MTLPSSHIMSLPSSASARPWSCPGYRVQSGALCVSEAAVLTTRHSMLLKLSATTAPSPPVDQKRLTSNRRRSTTIGRSRGRWVVYKQTPPSNTARLCPRPGPGPLTHLRKSGRASPADHGRHPLGDLVGPSRPLIRHRVGPLRVEQLAAVLHPQRGLQVPGVGLPPEGLHDGAVHAALVVAPDGLRRGLHGARIGVVLLRGS